MGIYDRDYIRDESPPNNWGVDGLTPGVKYLILANVVVFLLQIFVMRDVRPTPLEMMRRIEPNIDNLLVRRAAGDRAAAAEIARKFGDWNPNGDDVGFGPAMPVERVSVVTNWLDLDTRKVLREGQLWRLMTHAFCHDSRGLMHILFNMLGLFWFGCTLETMYGTREFLFFYFAAVLAAALSLVGLDLATGSFSIAVGASGGVMGVLMLYAYHFPTSIILLFWVVPVQIRFVVVLYALWDLYPVLQTLSGKPQQTGIAHAAHLGGLVFGFLYAKGQWRLSSLIDRLSPASWTSHWPQVSRLRRSNLRIAPETAPERCDPDCKKLIASSARSPVPAKPA